MLKKFLATSLIFSFMFVASVSASQNNLNSSESNFIQQGIKLGDKINIIKVQDAQCDHQSIINNKQEFVDKELKLDLEDGKYALIKKTYTAKDVAAKDDFVISVAKGQTTKLSFDKKFELDASLSINTYEYNSNSTCNSECQSDDNHSICNSESTYDFNSLSAYLNLTGKLSCEFKKEDKFKGPCEFSEFNSREYRIKFYENQGTYSFDVYQSNQDGEDELLESCSGEFKEPAKFALYSIDKLEI